MTHINYTYINWLKYSLWGVLFLALLTPLLVSSSFIFPFITLKTFYFKILAEVALFLYILLALADKNYRPQFNSLLWSILMFLFVVLITSIVGLNPFKSLWGTIERGEGFNFLAHLVVYIFILSQLFRSHRIWLNYFTFSISIAILVGLYALSQQAGFDLSWIVPNSSGGRLSSTLGNPAYLAAYSLGHFWLAVYLFLRRPFWLWRIFFGLSAVFNIYLLFNTQTRGAMLAFIATIFLFIIYFIFTSRYKKIKYYFLAVLFLLFLSAGFIYLNKDKPWIAHSGPFHRLVNISLNDTTVESRLYALDSSWKGWQDRFLFGYGWENYNYAFNRYFHPEIYKDSGSRVWFDRAHNTILDIAVTSGLFGLLSYLSIYFFAFKYLFNKLFQSRQHVYLPLMLMLVAHFLQNLFVFDSLPTYIMLFGAFAYVSSINLMSAYPRGIADKKTFRHPWISAVALVLLLVAIYQINIKPAQANQHGLSGMKLIYQNKILAGIKKLQGAAQMSTYQSNELRQKIGENAISRVNPTTLPNTKQLEQAIDLAIQEVKTNIQRNPYSTRNYLFLMGIYNNAMSYLRQNYYTELMETAQTALELSPTRPQLYYQMGRAAITAGYTDEGIGYFKKVVNLNPQTLDAHWNLLTAHIVTNHLEQAQTQYEKMLELGLSQNEPHLERLAGLYETTNHFSEAADYYSQLAQLKPNKYIYYKKSIDLYVKSGKIKVADGLARQAINKFPDKRQEINELINR